MIFRRRSDDAMAGVERLLDGYELPSFPHVVTDALARLGDPDVAMSDVADGLETDPGLSVKLLGLANSASIGLRKPVDSLRQAVAMLGRNQVESILISTAARASIPAPVSPVFDSGRFWRAAASRAVVAAAISAEVEPGRRSETFTAALLQDMALPVLIDHVDGYAALLARHYDGEVLDLTAAETDAFGWDHAMVATRMGTMWGLPDSLLEAIAGHHDVGELTELVGVRVVAGWHEVDEDAGREAVIASARAVPRLADHDCAQLVDRALERVGEVASAFS